ncbi:hypothetical protein SBY92_004142 [Candida maltosa Xu316]
MPPIKKNKKVYDQKSFRRILRSKLLGRHEGEPDTELKKDNCDILIYLLYLNYINELIKEGGEPSNGGAGISGEVTVERIENGGDKLIKKYQG